jgi:hypothetical protein
LHRSRGEWWLRAPPRSDGGALDYVERAYAGTPDRAHALFEVIPFKEELRRARPLHVVKAFVPPGEGKTDRGKCGHWDRVIRSRSDYSRLPR